jgi:flagellar biosynthetic protein FliQ
MDASLALHLTSEMLKLGLLLCGPLLLVILVSGLLISIVQVVTQIQDPSLAFVPKLIVFVIMLLLMTPWMLQRLMAYATSLYAQLGQLG